MAKTAIISVDGHVKASRAGYRDYIQARFLDAYDHWVGAEEEAGTPDAGNLNPEYGFEAQWDSGRRLDVLEGQGVVAEVLFPNGQPFQVNRFEDAARAADAELAAEGRRAYNRWLVDFCAEAPGRRCGQAVVSFDDIDQAVKDVYRAKEQGLGGIMMPALNPGGKDFFDPVLDPIWAAVQDAGLPLSQHGGAGLPGYSATGFAAILTVSIENGFFSVRSLWQMIAGGVFDRFPGLRMAFIETQLMFLVPAIAHLDMTLGWTDDWMAFARFMNRDRTVKRLASEYIGENCFVGVSPFDPRQLAIDQLVGKDEDSAPLEGFHIGADAAMFGVDYPHFESFVPHTLDKVALLAGHPSVTPDDSVKILYQNAATLFGFDLGLLQPHVERVGFELETVAAASAG
ncbi:MAG TPA: amidohydrolase family protein [Acidimicrobiales bacterium]|nr:amidohydrolase family protein [Acidimicrobiales bacterium]